MKDVDTAVPVVLAAAPVPAFIVGRDGTVTDANGKAADLAPSGTLVGASVEDAFGPDLAHLAASGRGTAEVVLGAGTFIVQAIPSVRESTLVLLTDVSKYLALQEEAEATARSRSEFLARLSHEIRSAVGTMVGFSEVLREHVSTEQAELARLITSSGRHLVDTLNSVMDLAQVEFADAEIEVCDVDMVSRVKERISAFRAIAERKGVSLVFEPEATSVTARLNPTYFDRIAHNLIDNAIKYTDEGTVEVDVEARDGAAWLYVADTGAGIDEAFLPRLFSPFEREGSGRAADGVGLGLAVTKYLVELMGGRIFACSTKGHGSTFTVRFPLADR